jgi:hypothetical protein
MIPKTRGRPGAPRVRIGSCSSPWLSVIYPKEWLFLSLSRGRKKAAQRSKLDFLLLYFWMLLVSCICVAVLTCFSTSREVCQLSQMSSHRHWPCTCQTQWHHFCSSPRVVEPKLVLTLCFCLDSTVIFSKHLCICLAGLGEFFMMIQLRRCLGSCFSIIACHIFFAPVRVEATLCTQAELWDKMDRETLQGWRWRG